jgi:hypothetical protein
MTIRVDKKMNALGRVVMNNGIGLGYPIVNSSRRLTGSNQWHKIPTALTSQDFLDHDVSLEDVAQSRRVVSPSGTVVWRLPDTRELAVLWQVTDYRS